MIGLEMLSSNQMISFQNSRATNVRCVVFTWIAKHILIMSTFLGQERNSVIPHLLRHRAIVVLCALCSCPAHIFILQRNSLLHERKKNNTNHAIQFNPRKDNQTAFIGFSQVVVLRMIHLVFVCFGIQRIMQINV